MISINNTNIQTFQLILENIDQMQKESPIPMRTALLERAKIVISNYKRIAEHLSEINMDSSDAECNEQINSLVDIKAEKGFSGKHRKLLKERIDIIISTYMKAQLLHKAEDFFFCFSKGDSCLNGSTESLYKFAASLEGIDIYSMGDPEKGFFCLGVLISDIICTHFNSEFESQTLTLSMVQEYMQSHIQMIAQSIENKKNTDGYRNFVCLLESRNIPSHNWEETLNIIINNPALFEAFYSIGLSYC